MNTFPIIISTTKQGQEKHWTVHVMGDQYWTEYFIPDGKHVCSEPITATSKNVGKKNETSPQEQALKEAKSLWNKKKQTVESETIPKPMLANSYNKYGEKYLTEPFGSSPKLDGIRMLCVWSEVEQTVHLYTRNRKKIKFLYCIKKSLKKLFLSSKTLKDTILDGEIYAHHLPCAVIAGIVNRGTEPSPQENEVGYHIFDCIRLGTYCDRMSFLRSLCIKEPLYLVDYTLITHNDVEKYHTKYIEQGYEGIMLRDMNSLYESFRSNYLLKYKSFQDDEFLISDFTVGKGREKDAIIFICQTETGRLFNVRPMGAIDYRKVWLEEWNRCSSSISYLTVRYQGLDQFTGIPRFPVGIRIREFRTGEK